MCLSNGRGPSTTSSTCPSSRRCGESCGDCSRRIWSREEGGMSAEMSVQVNQEQRVGDQGKPRPGKRTRPRLARLRRGRRANLILATQVGTVLAALVLWQLLSGRVIQSFL